MDTSNPETPVTPADSQGDSMRPESTLPSSPIPDPADQDVKREESLEDMEGMDTKAKALMHLLKTSSVCCLYTGGTKVELMA